jgi:uncharacterized protein (TIGR03435 family)
MPNTPSITRKFDLQAIQVLTMVALAAFAPFLAPQKLQAVRQPEQQQAQAANLPDLDYDVVSIKPTDPDTLQTGNRIQLGIVYSADGFDAKNVRLWGLLLYAYGYQQSQVTGAPDWWDDARFNISAKVDGETAEALQKLPPDQLKLVRDRMLQKLLADRFQLKFHHDTKEMEAYFLSIAKGGPKLQEHKSDQAGAKDLLDFEGNRAANRTTMTSDGNFVGQAVTMTRLAADLANILRTPVVDRTGLTGVYDFTAKLNLEYGPPMPTAAGGVQTPAPPVQIGSLITEALQKDAGLKVEHGKGPVDIIVIDHVEKPSDN